jgi:glucosamine-6-phosphate deaminase
MNKASWRKSPYSNKEKIHTEIYGSSLEASKSVAHEVAFMIKQRASENKKCVLGLATGSTPKTLYAELIRLHKEEGLSFANVVTFNLDEYYPMNPTDIQSYHLFMHEHLFDHLDIPKEQIHIPRGDLVREEVAAHCEEYERLIDQQGGIDIQILGIGRTGHIGFNEPGSSKESGTRMISLDHITRVDAASDFFGEENVPKQAVTMGIGSIMKAQRVFIMAWGEGKSAIVKQAIEGDVDERIPATYLQHHSDAIFILDEAAGAMLTRQSSPWVMGEIQWTDDLAKKAVIWLCLKLGKPILKLTNRDYTDNGMGDLLLEKGSAYDLNIDIFNKMQRTITGWPGGKPNADDSHRPERKDPARKRVIIFSPHPDDDVISMGGTFIRLVQQGHEVHVAYQTSGNIAVFNEDVMQYADFVDLLSVSGLMQQKTSLHEQVQEDIRNKKVSEEDSPAVRQVKGLIRKAEARAASHYVGIPDDQIHFLDLPFYETGQIKKNPIDQEDIFKGKVIDTDYFLDTLDYFHTKSVIQVNEIIHGLNDPKKVMIYSQSGQTNNGQVGYSHEITLDPGEEGIFFVKRIDIHGLKEFKLNGGTLQNINILINDQPFYVVYKLKEVKGVLYDYDGEEIGKTDEKLNQLRQISELKREGYFYQIDFSK